LEARSKGASLLIQSDLLAGKAQWRALLSTVSANGFLAAGTDATRQRSGERQYDRAGRPFAAGSPDQRTMEALPNVQLP
jgi:hypothetical protein